VQVVFTDLQKALDSVSHDRLISKLSNLNILVASTISHLVAWISSYLCSRKQQVGVSGINSTTVNVISCVPQGSVLGALLLLIYKVVWSLSDFRDLQSDIDSLVQWISDHDLKLNIKKVQIASIVKETGANMYLNCDG